MIDYSACTVESLLLDEHFREWIKKPTAELHQYWAEVMERYPSTAPLAEEAKAVLLALEFGEGLSGHEKLEMWQTIEKGIEVERQSKLVALPARRRAGFVVWGHYAGYAAIAMAVTAGIWLYKSGVPPQKTITEYGEIKKLDLPDGSSITVNANSTLDYKGFKKVDASREVWLKGEAFFKVAPARHGQPFVVHTADMDIEVLGTEFNVYQRLGKTTVSLNSGKIRLILHGQGGQPLVMRPGEMVEINPAANRFIRTNTDVDNYSSWKEYKWEFDDTPLSEIIERMRNAYGWTIQLEDSSILFEKLSGEMESRDQDSLLSSLSKAMNLTMERSGDTVYISRKPKQ